MGKKRRKVKKKTLKDFILENNIEEISEEMCIKLWNVWDKAFCPFSDKIKEDIHYDDYKWHVFSYEVYDKLEGESALKEYINQVSREYYVLANDNEIPVVIEEVPSSDLLNFYRDCYIMPKNMAWTMVFTHESWIYFAKNRNYKKLNKKNVETFHNQFGIAKR